MHRQWIVKYTFRVREENPVLLFVALAFEGSNWKRTN